MPLQDGADKTTKLVHQGDLAGLGRTPPLATAWDRATALDRVEGDKELLEELARLFAEGCPKAMREIRGALDANDARLLERHAHTLKGSSANIGAHGTFEAALALEHEARSGNLAKAREQFQLLGTEIERLLSELEAVFSKAAP